MALYASPTLFVRDSSQNQTKGLRQGCPLYLFGFVLTHLFHDVEPNNKRKNTSYRVSQTATASKLLRPLLFHGSISPSWKLTVYRSSVLSILMYAMDSVVLTSLQLRKLDTIHCKSLRRIFKIKSFYHRILDPTDAHCSNQYLASLAYGSRRVQSPSQLYSQQRLQLFGHIHRHPESIENRCTYMTHDLSRLSAY